MLLVCEFHLVNFLNGQNEPETRRKGGNVPLTCFLLKHVYIKNCSMSYPLGFFNLLQESTSSRGSSPRRFSKWRLFGEGKVEKTLGMRLCGSPQVSLLRRRPLGSSRNPFSPQTELNGESNASRAQRVCDQGKVVDLYYAIDHSLRCYR